MIAFLNPRPAAPFLPGNVMLAVHAPNAVSVEHAKPEPVGASALRTAIERACRDWMHDGGTAHGRPWTDYLGEAELEAYSRMLEGE